MEDEKNEVKSQKEPEQSWAARWLCSCKGTLRKRNKISKLYLLSILGSAKAEEEEETTAEKTSFETGNSGAVANVEEEN